MEKISTIMNGVHKYKPKSEEKKIEMYSKFAQSRIKFFETQALRLKNETRVKELQIIARNEFYKGDCPRCVKSWVKIDFDNLFSKGTYWQPNCDCFYFCPYCESHLYDYEVTGYLKNNNFVCPFCSWQLIVDNQKRHGFEFAYRLKNMSRAEKYKLLVGNKQEKGNAKK